MERHKFNIRIQKEGESFQSFVADLRILANTCEYGILKDELIRDKIICGVGSRHVRKQLLKERELALDRAIDIGIANKLSDRNNTKLSSNQVSDSKEEIHGVDKGGLSKKDSKPGIENCRNCGDNHAAKQKSCPAFGKKCLYCGKPNHFDKVCRSKRDGGRLSTRDRRRRPRRSVQTVDPQHPIGQDDDLFVIDTMEINAQPLKLKLTLALNVM